MGRYKNARIIINFIRQGLKLLVQQCFFPCCLCSSFCLIARLTKFIASPVSRSDSPGFRIIPGKELKWSLCLSLHSLQSMWGQSLVFLTPLVNPAGSAGKIAIQDIRGYTLNFEILPAGERGGAVRGLGGTETWVPALQSALRQGSYPPCLLLQA